MYLNGSEMAICFPDYPGMDPDISQGYTQEYTLINYRTYYYALQKSV